MLWPVGSSYTVPPICEAPIDGPKRAIPALNPSGSVSSYSKVSSWMLIRSKPKPPPYRGASNPRGRRSALRRGGKQMQHPPEPPTLEIVVEQPHAVLSVRDGLRRTSP